MRSNAGTFIEQARRRQIIDGAIALLADGGSGAASLAAIAQRIGVSKGVISYHFAGKDEVLTALVEEVLTDAATFMTAQIAQAASPTERLRAYVRSNLTYLATHRPEIGALTAVLNAVPPSTDGTPVYEASGQNAVQSLTDLLTEGQRAGEFAAFAAPVAARSLRAAIDAVTGLLRTDPHTDVEAYGAELLALFERAVLA